MMDPPAPLAPALAAGARFGAIGPEAAPAIAAGFGAAAGEEFQARLTPGRRAYAVWQDDAVAVVGWASFTPEHIGEQGLWVRLRPGEAYVWDCVTQPRYRRQGLYRALLAHMAAALLAEGCPRVWIGADLGNDPSQRGIAAAGFRPVVDLLIAPLSPRLQLFWLETVPGATDAMAAAAQYALFGERLGSRQSAEGSKQEAESRRR